jgi:hypothetical protein
MLSNASGQILAIISTATSSNLNIWLSKAIEQRIPPCFFEGSKVSVHDYTVAQDNPPYLRDHEL